MDRSDPPYLRIVAELRRRIAAGELGPGERVPSTRRITQEWGVAMATATKVLTTLRQEGLVRAVPGVGTVVAEPTRPAPAEPTRPAPAEPARGRRTREGEGGLSRERVVRAGIKVADAEGLRALSMRRVAAEFGVSSMALYRHVTNKQELVMAMAEQVFAECELPDPAPRDWRGRMAAGARLQWGLYQRHAWLAQYLSLTRPQPMPSAMALIEWTMGRVTGLDPVTTLHIALTLLNYVRGTAVNLEEDLEAEQETGMDRGQWMNAQESAYLEIITSGPYPMYSGIEGMADEAVTLETLFDFGLARLLDGFAPVIEGRGR